jgi:hypothetical protein
MKEDLVIVERSFAEPVAFEELQAREDRGAWCLEAHRVRFHRTYFSTDRRRMLCLYCAPDAEAVRLAQHKAGMPVEHVWSAQQIAPGPELYVSDALSVPRVWVVVERRFDPPINMEKLVSLMEGAESCLETYGVSYRGGHLAHDGTRMLCIFQAPDAEAVRQTNQDADMPVERLWTATVHDPPQPA